MRNVLEVLTLRPLMAALTLLCALEALAPLPAHAQVTPSWVNVSSGLHGEMLALDRENNVYVAGSVPWSTMWIAKYSASGGSLWTRIFDNPGTREQSAWITVDPSGNAIVTGYIVGGDGGAANGLIVLKYSPEGTLIWQDVVRSASGYASRAATDAAGNVYVIARTWPAGPGANPAAGIATLVAIKYAPSGTRVWTRDFGFDRVPADAPASILVSPSGNLMVIGGTDERMLIAACDPAGNLISSKSFAASPGDIAVGPSGEFYAVGGPRSNPANAAFFVVKVDANLNELWRRAYPVGRWGWRVAVDSLGNAVVTGVAGDTSLDWMTIKLDPDGALLWTRRYDAHPSRDEIPFAMAIGADDSVVVTGQAGLPRGPATAQGLSTVTVKYAADGTQLWAAATSESDRGLGVRLGSDNSVFVVGESPLTVLHYKQTGH